MRHDRLSAGAIVLVTMCCVAWGVQQVAIKVAAANGLPPVFQASLRSGGATLLGLAWLPRREGRAGLRALPVPSGTWLPRVAIAALFAGEFIFIYLGLALTSASRAALFVFTAPFFTAMGAQWFLPHDKMRPASSHRAADRLRWRRSNIRGRIVARTRQHFWRCLVSGRRCAMGGD